MSNLRNLIIRAMVFVLRPLLLPLLKRQMKKNGELRKKLFTSYVQKHVHGPDRNNYVSVGIYDEER